MYKYAVSNFIAFRKDCMRGECGKEQVLITDSAAQGFTSRCCLLLARAAT